MLKYFKVTVLYAGELNIFHRMVEDGRHLWKASGPSSSKDTQSRMCRITSSQIWCLQGWELHNLCGGLLPALNHPHSKRVTQLVSAVSCPELSTT